MADLAALRTALGRLGFTDEAANAITDTQGINDLAELELLTDSEVENLCKVVRRPGGEVANPNAAVGQPNNVPNHGTAVSLRAENNLKLACFFLKFRTRTSRATTAAQITLDSVRVLRDHREWEKNHKDVDAPEINARDWPRTIDAIEEWLRGCLGVTKIPLAYVVRDNVEALTVDPVGGFTSKQEEQIARAPIVTVAGGNVFTATYMSDHAKVWEKMSELTRDHECWSYVRPAQRSRDGRLAYMGLKGHYLGVNNVDNMSTAAERKLQTTSYTGEQRRWIFEKYVKIHVDQHDVLQGLMVHGYAGIDNRSKVRHLVAGIKTTTLDSVKTRIMSDAALHQDFDACVNLYKDFIKQKSASSTTHDSTIASFKSSGGSKGGNGGGNGGGNKRGGQHNVTPDMSMEDRYYSKKEYDALSPAKKAGLRAVREKRGHVGNKNNKSSKRPKLSNREIKAIAAAVRKETDDANEGTDNDSSSDDDDDVPMKPAAKNNRNNSALQRKK